MKLNRKQKNQKNKKHFAVALQKGNRQK